MSKAEAIKVARERRANGEAVKVVRIAGVYTVPGRGLTPYLEYRVVPAK
jgi:hypothetical protein